MTDPLKIQGEVSLDSSDAEQALGRVEQRAGRMAQSVKQSGQDAGKGVSAIGEGAEGAAQRVDRATSSLVASIQRTTAAMEAGGKSSSAYYEAIAKQRGIDPNILKPYIDALRQAEEQQKKTSSTLGQVGTSAEKTAQQLRQVGPQVTDIVTQLASGQAPLQILIQQGGQLKDVFGGIGPAARALGGYLAALISPTALLVGGVGALGIAYAAGRHETEAFNKALTLSGNALGLTTTSYADLRKEIGGIATQGKAAEVLTQIASSGVIAASSVRQISEAAILMEKATGQATDKTIAHFVDLAKSPADAAAKLNEQYNFLTSATYQQIKALEEQGRTSEAAKVATDAYAQAVHTRSQSIVDDAGLIEKAWREVVSAINSGIDAAKNIGRPDSNATQLEQVRRDIEAKLGNDKNRPGGPLFGPSLEDLREQEKRLQRIGEIQAASALATAEQARQTKATIEAEKILDQYKSKEQQRLDEEVRVRNVLTAAGRSQLEIEKAIAEVRKRYTETTGQSEVAGIQARLQALRAYNTELQKQIQQGIFPADKQLTPSEQKAIALQNELAGSINGVARAEKQKALAAAEALIPVEKENAALLKQRELVKQAQALAEQQATAVYDQALSIRQQAEEQEAANAVFSKGRVAVEEYRLAQMKATLAELDASDSADPKFLAGLNAKIEAQQRLVKATQAAADKQLELNGIRLSEANQRETDLLQYELSVVNQVADVRALLIERRRIELEYAQRLAELDRAEGSPEKKASERARIENEKIVALNNATTRAVVEKWQRAADEINDALTNAIEDWVLNGKSLSKSLANAFKQEFANLVLRPTIQAVMSPIAGAINSFVQPLVGSLTSTLTSSITSSLGLSTIAGKLGLSSLASGAASTTGSGLSLAASNTAFNQAIGSGAASSGYAAASAIPIVGAILAGMALDSKLYDRGYRINSTGDALTSQLVVAGAGPTGRALEALGVNSKLASILSGSSIAAYVSRKLGIIGETRGGGQYGYSFNGTDVLDPRRGTTLGASGVGATFLEGPSGGDPAAEDGKAAINSTVATIQSILEAVGSSIKLTQYQAGYESSDRGRGGVFAGGTFSNGISFGESGKGDNYAGTLFESTSAQSGDLKEIFQNFVTDNKQSVIEAVQSLAGQIPKTLTDIVQGVDAEGLSDEAAQAMVTKIMDIVGTVQSFGQVVAQMPLADLKNLSFDAAAALVQFSGGLQTLTSNLQTYYTNFYSSEEQRQQTAQSIAKTLQAAGVQVAADQIATMTREQFRAIVESFDPATEAGEKARAALYGVAGAFASITDASTQAAASVTDWQKSVDAAWTLSFQKQQAAAQATAEFNGSVLGMIQGSFEAVRKSITDMVKEIRGEITGEQAGAGSLQQQFQQALLTVMQGGKGSQAAAASLPELAQQLSAALPDLATSRLDLLTQQAGIAQHLLDANDALRVQQRLSLESTYAALTGSSVAVPSYQARPVADYSSRPLLGELQALRGDVRRMHTAIEAVASHTASTSKNTREAIDRGIPALADPSA
jgi:phage-related minor tail protein